MDDDINRLKLLVAAALLGLPLAACDSETAPPPVGQIDGQVVIEGEGIDGVSVTLSSGAATTTSGGGHYSFTDVEGGTYTITISGYPDDASFDQTTAEVTIASSGQTINRSFSGAWIRTASLMGMVTVEGVGLPGITVAIAGRQDAQMLTDDNGQYTFTGLRAGNYTVEISGFDATDVAFSATSSAVEVAVGESKVWSFEGTYVRESTIAGQVSVEGNGLAGVTISLQGMGADESENTDMGGQFTFSNLRAGEYQLAISGFDTREYGFSTTSATVRVEHGRTANVPFEGIMLRTASIMGQVSIEGEGLADVTVSLSGEGESLTTMTDNSGQYAFSDLPAGNFQVGISGYDTDDYSFETTSKNVALALGETATVPFEGILLRTSGISGRVSVEGMGLDSVTVTLSGDDLADDMTTMTDATGQYAIAGLAEGEYTVAISDYDDVAYVFDNTSMDVDLGDDDTQIVNFMGMHARTASVTVKLFVDEGTKNDMMDEGEMMFPTPQILGMVAQLGLPLQLPITLAGPGVLDVQSGTPMPDGSVVFANLRAGSYQVVVSDISADVLALLPPALATVLQDYSYGGPATGYPLAIAVGQEATQYAPVDITHQTVNFSVNLKSGEMMGAALPGATVSFFSDMAGEQKIGDAMPGAADGMYYLRFSRSMATNNMVYASVAAPSGDYHTSGAMQAVMWDAKYPMSMASNDEDIVNTMASFSFSGATRMTDLGGGMSLGGWAIEVTSGDDAVADAPDELDDDGMASFSETVDAGDLPKTYMIAMADDQANDSTGDGGEKYMSTTLMHTHDGLSLAGTSTDAGMLVVTYTTQTLKVFVHQENDQVMGYTGNVLGGDVRMGGIIDVDIEHIDANGRARSFEATDSIGSSAGGGAYTFSNVPAAAKVIVTADEYPTLGNDADGDPIANTAHLLDKNGHSDEIAAYTGIDANGIMGGAFGPQGGFHHTVYLCPLMSDEGDQRHGECGTFAFVETFAVNGQAWKWVRNKSSDDFVSSNSRKGQAGLTVSMDPVTGENLAGESDSFEEKGNTKGFDFGRMPAGVYTVTVSDDGWMAQRGPLDEGKDDLDDYLSPLDTALNIEVTPKTGYAYGAVTDKENRRLAGVTVNVNGVSVETDSNGRYVAEGFGKKSCSGSGRSGSNLICVQTSEEGSAETKDAATFRANMPTRIDIEIEDATEITTISGTVTHSDGSGGVGNVRVWVDGVAPLNKNAKSKATLKTDNIYVTASDGSFSVRIAAKAGGATATITVSKDGMFFSPDGGHTFSAVAGQNISGIAFSAFDNGTIHGRVVDGDNDPISGVIVTATQVGGDATDADTTGTTGTYSLSVRYGQFNVGAEKHGYEFTMAENINVPNDGKAIDDLVGTPAEDNADLSSLSLSGVTLRRSATATGFRTSVTSYTAEVGYSTDMTTVSATPSVPGASVTEIYPDDADANTSGHQVALDVGTTTIEVEVTAADGTTTQTYTVAVTRLAETTTITGTVTDAQSGDAISGVRINVSGGHLLNGGANSYVSTNSSGEYKVVMESGGATTLTPTKDDYTFDPATRSVELNAGTVSGADFAGSAYATITGTVMAGTTPLEGVMVEATSGGVSDDDMTDRRGRFSVSVPAGTATVTATKTGYTFASQNVSLVAGESRSVGNIMATGNMAPLSVEAARDTTTDANTFGTTVTVTWAEGPGGRATQYMVQILDTLGVWEDIGSAVTAPTADNDPPDADSTWTAQITPTTGDDRPDPEGALSIRVMAQHDHDEDAATATMDYPSDAVTVDAVDPTASNVEARRDIDDEPDSLVVTWDAKGNTNSAWRVVISFDGGETWYEAGGTAAGGSWGRTVAEISGTTPNEATNDGTSGDAKSAAVTDDEINGALMFRVDARQGTVSTDNEWKLGPTVSVDAKSG